MHAEDARDLHKGADADVYSAGFDGLIRGSAEAGGEEDALLGAVLAEAGDADPVTEGPPFAGEPLVVIGQGRHSINALPMMIISQPGLPGII